jgi:hypothetical protein
MTRRTLILLAALLTSAQGRADAPDRALFPFVKDLAPPDDRPNTLGVVLVDEEVLAATDDRYASLRVLTEAQAETPFLVRTRRIFRRGMQQVEDSLRTVSLRTREDNAIEIILSREKDSDTPSSLQFDTQERNFEKSVSIEGSVSGAEWVLLAGPKPIFDYSRFLDMRNTRVEFPAGPYAQYRVMVSNITERTQSPMTQFARDTRDGKLVSEVENTSFLRNDFRIDRIRAFEQKPTEVRAELITRDYTVTDFAVTNNAKEKTTVVTFRTARAPLTSFTLIADDPNFSRTCTLEATDARDASLPWAQVASARLTRVRAGQFHMEDLGLVPGRACRFRNYRLTILNQDSPPLRITGIAAKGEVHELVFFVDRAHSYRLLYGGDGAPVPQYDIGAVLQSAETATMDAYHAGDQKPNPEYRPGQVKRFTLDGRKLMVGAIVLMVGVLAWIVIAAARRLEPPSPGA